MKCPRCNASLKISEHDGVMVDVCQECKGVWLDRGELEKIVQLANSASFYNYEVPDGERKGQRNLENYKEDKLNQSILDFLGLLNFFVLLR